ncbi:hypothetical protein [Butyrivibrio sp. NC2007]|uniref:hypothetical protein n=1 Tax=Butyrivibrio sp. NC2007 TaxID=1280683 RepID=UPI0003B62D1F|nr:hypothetical protein [Butyrivibrio sp. NC2007]
MSNTIILTKESSEYEYLVMQIKQLKLNVAALTVEKDDLELNECRKLSADYDRNVGHLELEITRYNLEIERLRSVIESMQAAVNRGQTVSREDAEEQADEKFKDFFDDIEKQAEKVKADEAFAAQRDAQDQENHEGESYDDDEEIDWEKLFEDMEKFSEFFDSFFNSFNRTYEGGDDGDDSSDGGSAKKNVNPDKELRMLYLKIMKALHPDNKPIRTEKDDQLLLEAKEAFETGNLKRLREIAEMIEDDDIEGRFNDSPEGIEELRRLLQQLIEQKDTLVKSIAHIKNSFPYNMKLFLSDPDAVAAKQEELKGIIESCKNTIAVLNERIELLQKEMDAIGDN